MNSELYAGFYQGVAWVQGAADGPVTVNIPDELMTETDPMPFNLVDFMRVVADYDDEGGIHYWEIDPAATTMTLYCTEDNTSRMIPDTALHASGWLALARD